MVAGESEAIGPYEVLRLLGAGGMGSVYLALDGDGRTVAVKVLHPHIAVQAQGLERMEREAEAMRQVRSPYVAEIVDVDLTGESPYLVTRYVQGLSLHRIIEDRGPLSGDALRTVARGLAKALEVIHAAGVVHRDLTPRNVMMADGTPVVIDLGLALSLDATRMTQGVIGTPGYVAPEVLNGERPGPAADVFAWGATVVFAATGEQCFRGFSVMEIFNKVLNEVPDLDGVPFELVADVAAALAKDPKARPEAGALVGGAVQGDVPPSPQPVGRAVHAERFEPVHARFHEAMAQGDVGAAVAAATELGHVATEAANREQIAWGLRYQGEALVARGDHYNAWVNFERGRALAAEIGLRGVEAACLHGLGICAVAGNDPARAEHALRTAIAIALEIGDATVESACAFELAVMAEQRRDFPQAEWMYERVRQLAVAATNREDQAHALYGLGTCAVEQRQFTRAEACLSEALRIAEELSDTELQDWLVDELIRINPRLR